MPGDRWVDLAGDFGEPTVPPDLREQIERRVARLQAEGAGATLWRPRWSSMSRWLAASVVLVLVVAALAIAAHSRQQPSTPARSGHIQASVVLLAQQGHFGGSSVVGWRTKQRARVVCGAHPGVTSSAGNNGIRPSDLCRALAYYPAHSTESRCSYTSIIGPIVPSRVVITGTINGQPVHLDMGMLCNPPAKLGQMTGLISATVFGYPDGVKATIGENTFERLTRVAQSQAQALGDPKVHSATLVLTTRRRMNSALGFGTQPTQNQDAKVFVIQLLGRFTCNTCSYPAGGNAPTGSAVQDVLSYGSLSGTDFGVTATPVVMQRMGPIMHLTWKPGQGATQPSSAAVDPTSVLVASRIVPLDPKSGWGGTSTSTVFEGLLPTSRKPAAGIGGEWWATIRAIGVNVRGGHVLGVGTVNSRADLNEGRPNFRVGSRGWSSRTTQSSIEAEVRKAARTQGYTVLRLNVYRTAAGPAANVVVTPAGSEDAIAFLKHHPPLIVRSIQRRAALFTQIVDKAGHVVLADGEVPGTVTLRWTDPRLPSQGADRGARAVVS